MNLLSTLYWGWIKLFCSNEQYARKIGVKLGNNNFIADKNAWSSEPYLITIGNYCQITAGVRFLTHGGGHVLRDKIADFDTFGKIQVGDWVYIGSNSLIMPGVTIDDHVLVAAGSVVTKSIPSGVVVAGNPARIICDIEDYRKRNNTYNVHTKGIIYSEKKILIDSLPDEAFIKKDYIK